jgi:hypothetical protein
MASSLAASQSEFGVEVFTLNPMRRVLIVDFLGKLSTVSVIVRILQPNKERHNLTSLLRRESRELGLKHVDAHGANIVEAIVRRKLLAAEV